MPQQNKCEACGKLYTLPNKQDKIRNAANDLHTLYWELYMGLLANEIYKEDIPDDVRTKLKGLL